MPDQPGRKDSGIIDYQTVSGMEQRGKIIKKPVLEFTGFSVQTEKTGMIPFRNRCLGN